MSTATRRHPPRTDPATRFRRLQLLPILTLTVIWVLLWGTYTPVSIAGGVLLAVAVSVLFPLPPLALGLRLRPVPFLVLCARFAYDLVRASIIVSTQSVLPWVHPRGHLVTVDLLSDDDLFAVITAEMTALVPGSVVIDLEPHRRRMTLHVFDASEDELVRVADRVRATERRVLRALARDADTILAGDS